jgi:zinc-dependent metalloproteinase lipoprotein
MIINTIKTITTALVICLSLNVCAQEPASKTRNGVIPCVATEYARYLQNKSGKETAAQFESWLAPKLAAVKSQRSAQQTNQVVTLPVVVHIIHDGDEVGISENIPDERILSQIQVLNEDFRRIQGTRGYVEGNVGVDTEIQFCMAQQDPDGNATTGIDRVNLGRASWNSVETVDEEMKPATIWDPTRYINIWVCRFGGQLAQVGGYAYFPEASGLDGLEGAESGALNDGLAMSFKAFGTSDVFPATTYFPDADKGRSATHEMGHFFGLRHIWGDEDSCDATDYCDDTPAVIGLHFTCDAADTCPNSEGTDMIENHMDYTPDACKSIYTPGQKARMWTVLQNSPRRASLLTSNACSAPTMGTGENIPNGSIKLYPNPVKDALNIAFGSNTQQTLYTIYNVLGEAVANGNLNTTANATIDTAKLSQGVYVLMLNGQGHTKALRFVKE